MLLLGAVYVPWLGGGRNYSLIFRLCVWESRWKQAELSIHLSKRSQFKVETKCENSREVIGHQSSLNK